MLSGCKAWALDVLKYARENLFPWDVNICSRAAENGHLEILQWAHENGCRWNGSMKARANGCLWDEQTCSFAAYGGQLEIRKWARENGCPWNDSTDQSAAMNWNGTILIGLLHMGFPGMLALALGLQDMGIESFCDGGCPWDENTCSSACTPELGSFEILRYAHQNRCPWNENTCSEAAECGDIKTLI